MRKKILFAASILTLLQPVNAFGAGCLELNYDGQSSYHEAGNATIVKFIANYSTILSKQDTVNSSGAKLSGFRAVIQQDRANVNRFGKIDALVQSEPDENGKLVEWSISDDVDNFFITAERRAMLQDTQLVFACDQNDKPDDFEGSDRFKFWSDAVEAGEVPAAMTNVLVFKLPTGGLAMHLNFIG